MPFADIVGETQVTLGRQDLSREFCLPQTAKRFSARILPAFLCLFLQGSSSSAQVGIATLVVPESHAMQHLIEYQKPLYPSIAKIARVRGAVKVALVIDVDGSVVSEKVLTGPPMLQQAALDAVKHWRFTPFQVKGKATQASTTVTIPFDRDKLGEEPTAEQSKAAQAWFRLSDECRSAVKVQNAQNALESCKHALDVSFTAGDLTHSDQLARTDSHELYGHALLIAGRTQEAFEQENLAIQEARKCLKETDQEYAMPFFWRAIIEGRMDQVDAALADFDIAEATHRRAMLNLPEMKDQYGKYLASILKQHAILLDELGRSAEAGKLRAEASTL